MMCHKPLTSIPESQNSRNLHVSGCLERVRYTLRAVGLLWIECKQMYSSGLRVYLLDNYNLLDFIVLSLYLASYMLRFLVDRWIKQADRHYNGTERAREALVSHNYNEYDQIQHQIFHDISDSSQSYFMKARTSISSVM